MKPIRVYFLLLAVTLLVLSKMTAQPINALIQDVVLPAPNAASLGKYGDIPVNHFTGVPNISIPISTLQEGPLSLPISLNYHASGLKLAEMASWVGLGWSLNAGGMITRTVQGMPDDATGGYFYEGDSVGVSTTLEQLSKGERDGEPDLFSYSFSGYNGKFYFDIGRKINFIPQVDLEISYQIDSATGNFSSFILITPDGNRYIFGEIPSDTSSPSYLEKMLFTPQSIRNPSAQLLQTTSWYLQKIETPDLKHFIELSYSGEVYGYKTPASCQDVSIDCDGPGGSGSSWKFACFNYGEYNTGEKFNVSSIFGYRLSQIRTSHDTMDFVGATVREDLDSDVINSDGTIQGTPTAKRLDTIKISSGTFCRYFVFSYDYSLDATYPTRSESKRLLLTSLKEESCNGSIDIPPYTFSYIGYSGGSIDIPHRLSKQVDHWGFFNGKTVNESLPLNIPNTPVFSPYSSDSYFYLGGADRSSDASSMELGVLDTITYPTGGIVSLDYEANSYYGKGETGQVIHFLESCDTSTTCCQVQIYSMDSIRVNEDEINYTTFDLELNMLTDAFLFGGTDTTNLCSGSVIEVLISVYESGDTSNQIVGQYQLNLDRLTEISKSLFNLPLSELGNLTYGIYYRFELFVVNGHSKFTLKHPKIEAHNVATGGLRIKKTTTYDGISQANNISKIYTYEDTLAERSSGELFQPPQYGLYLKLRDLTQGIDQSQINDLDALYLHESSTVPMHSFQGFHIAYRRVQEVWQGRGKTHYHFSLDPGSPPEIYPIPPYELNVLNGKPTQTFHYDEQGLIVNRQTFTGSSNPSSVSQGAFFKVGPTVSCGEFLYNTYVPISSYPIPTSWYKLISQTDSLDGVITSRSFSYDPENLHQNPIKITDYNSNGRIQEQRFKYPLDYQDTLSFGNGSNLTMKALINQHMIGLPIETQVWEGDTSSLKMVSGQIQLYNNFGSGGDSIIKPFQIHILETATPLGQDAIDDDTDASSGLYTKLQPANISSKYVDRASFVYDSIYGNLVQQSLTDGTPISYIWGYSGNRPLAQVVGKTYDQIKSTSVNQLRSTFSDALVTTYTYNDRLQISSITQPNGVVTYYEYDALGRLIRTKDDDSELLQTIEYNYSQP